MGVKNWIKNFFGSNKNNNLEGNWLDMISATQNMQHVTKYATSICANLISNAISLGEFKVYENEKQVKNDLHFVLNERANENQSSFSFWQEVIWRLINDNECLIVKNPFKSNNKLYIADSFTCNQKISTNHSSSNLFSSVYSDVIVGDCKLEKIFSEEKVLHLKYQPVHMTQITGQVTKHFTDLLIPIKSGILKSNARRAMIELDVSTGQTPEEKEALQLLFRKRYLPFVQAESDAVLPITKGFKYEELIPSSQSSNKKDGREFRLLLDDVIELVALSLHIPPVLLTGEQADISKAIDDLITFCIKPLGEMIVQECTSKFYRESEITKGSYVSFDSSRIEHVNLEKLGNTLEILFRTGTHTINENRDLLGLDHAIEPIASKRFVSRNYMSSEEAAGGGNENEKERD